MNIKEIWDRAQLNSLENFILYEADGYKESAKKGYTQRLDEADANMNRFFEEHIKDPKEREKLIEYYYQQTEEYMEVYFEIGLLLGAKIEHQISLRMEEMEDILKRKNRIKAKIKARRRSGD